MRNVLFRCFALLGLVFFAVGCPAPDGPGTVYHGQVTMRADVGSEQRCADLLDPKTMYGNGHLPGNWFQWRDGDVQKFEVAAKVESGTLGIRLRHFSGVELAGRPYDLMSDRQCVAYLMDSMTPLGYPQAFATEFNNAQRLSTTYMCDGGRLLVDWHLTLLPAKGPRFDDRGDDHSCWLRVEGELAR